MYNMDIEYGRPFKGARKAELERFLQSAGIRYDEGVAFTALVRDGDDVVAAGSLDGNIIKCVATSPEREGEGLCAKVMTELHNEAFNNGVSQLFLYTKPSNRRQFEDFGFTQVACTRDTLLMENTKNGVERFVDALPAPSQAGDIGCVVANCNPYTLGHDYLMRYAAARCGFLYVFILSEPRSLFPPQDRLRLARAALSDVKNVAVEPSGGYLVSAATFPTYFLKTAQNADDVRCALDIAVFTQRIAPRLNITKRFVGTEPLSPVTAAYNRALQAELPGFGIEVIEVPRVEKDGAPVSATRVRELYLDGRARETRALVPDPTYEYLMRKGD